MANYINYAGIPLNLETPELLEHINTFLEFEQARLTTPQRVYPGPRLIEVSRPLHNVNRPKLKIGEWFYPVGMSRWSEVHLVTTDDYYQQLVAKGFSGGSPVANTFTFFQNGVGISTPMYILDIRPIGKMVNKPGCYLVTFVDERYWFNFTPVSLQVTSSTQWTDLINDVASALGISASNDSVPSAYLQPEPNSDLQARYENGAILADAIAFNVGMRWVRNLNGSYYLQNSTTSKSTVGGNAQNAWLAGGDSLKTSVLTNSVLPNTVDVSYLKWCNGDYLNPMHQHIPYWKNIGDEYLVPTPVSSVFSQFSGSPATKIFHDTAKALYTSCSDPTPSNLSELQMLSQQISSDYYSWLVDGIDQSFPLLVWTKMEGFHDVIWTWDNHAVMTRVSHLPWNYGCEELMHATPVPGSSSSSSGMSSMSSMSASSMSAQSGSGQSEQSGSGSGTTSGSGSGSSGCAQSFTIVSSVDLSSCTVFYETWCFSADGRLISVM